MPVRPFVPYADFLDFIKIVFLFIMCFDVSKAPGGRTEFFFCLESGILAACNKGKVMFHGFELLFAIKTGHRVGQMLLVTHFTVRSRIVLGHVTLPLGLKFIPTTRIYSVLFRMF